jgi:hypothetical protein
VLTASGGFPLRVSAVRPSSVHDLTAARELVLPTLYPHAARGLPVLAGKGYAGAGIGVRTPVRHSPGGAVLHTDTRTSDQLLTALRAPTERTYTLLGRWRALERLTICPWRITAVIAAALAPTTPQSVPLLERGDVVVPGSARRSSSHGARRGPHRRSLGGDAPSRFLVIRGALVGADRESSEPGGWSFEPLDL